MKTTYIPGNWPAVLVTLGIYILTHHQMYLMMTKVFMNVLAGYVTVLTSQHSLLDEHSKNWHIPKFY